MFWATVPADIPKYYRGRNQLWPWGAKTDPGIVTADTEDYTQALMFYEKKPRADVDVTAQNSGGVNLGGKPAIQMKGVTQPQTLAVKVFRWIKEDTSEVFQQVARETAGFDKAADNVWQQPKFSL